MAGLSQIASSLKSSAPLHAAPSSILRPRSLAAMHTNSCQSPSSFRCAGRLVSRQGHFAGPLVSSRRSRLTVQATSRCHGYPFSDTDYMRIELLNRPPYGPMKILPATDENANNYSGVLVFQRAHEQPLTADTPIMEIFVAGDTACNIYTQLHGQQSSRPMTHDLMYSLMERAGQLNPGHWQLLRVAVVALENDIFVGRLFFGDAATGTVMWDCDCRPSDGVYLSLRTQCPFFVARKVWEQAAVPIRESKVHLIAMHEAELAAVQQQQQQHPHPHAGHHQAQPHQGGASGSATTASMDTGGGRGGPTQVPDSSSSGGGGDASTSSPFEYTGIRPNDPDVIVLLKRELAIAVSEEDYAAAIRLRDHPYMQLYRRIEAFQQLGRANEAAALQRELASMITRNSDDAADAM